MLGATAPSALCTASSALESTSTRRRPNVVGERADGQQRGGEAQAHPAERPRLARDVAVQRSVAVADRGHDRAEHRQDEQRPPGGDRERSGLPSAASVRAFGMWAMAAVLIRASS